MRKANKTYRKKHCLGPKSLQNLTKTPNQPAGAGGDASKTNCFSMDLNLGPQTHKAFQWFSTSGLKNIIFFNGFEPRASKTWRGRCLKNLLFFGMVLNLRPQKPIVFCMVLGLGLRIP